MTLPVLPAALDTGDYVDNTWVDRVRAYHDYWGGSRPNVKVFYNGADDGGDVTVTLNTTTTIGNTSGTGTTVPIEVGETFWTASGSAGRRITAPVAGIYLIGGRVSWTSDSSGERMFGFQINGGGSQWMQTASPVNNTGFGQSFNSLESMDATDYFEIVCRSTSTAGYSAGRWWAQLISEQ